MSAECDNLACAIAAVEDWQLYGWMTAFFAAAAAIIPLLFYATAATSFRAFWLVHCCFSALLHL